MTTGNEEDRNKRAICGLVGSGGGFKRVNVNGNVSCQKGERSSMKRSVDLFESAGTEIGVSLGEDHLSSTLIRLQAKGQTHASTGSVSEKRAPPLIGVKAVTLSDRHRVIERHVHVLKEPSKWRLRGPSLPLSADITGTHQSTSKAAKVADPARRRGAWVSMLGLKEVPPAQGARTTHHCQLDHGTLRQCTRANAPVEWQWC